MHNVFTSNTEKPETRGYNANTYESQYDQGSSIMNWPFKFDVNLLNISYGSLWIPKVSKLMYKWNEWTMSIPMSIFQFNFYGTMKPLIDLWVNN